MGLKEEERVSDLLNELADLDYNEAEGGLDSDGKEKRNKLRVELANRMLWEAISWKKKVREKWLMEGDKNSKYFHCLANYRRRINYVEDILVNGDSVTGNEAMREAAKKHFQLLYKEEFYNMPKIDNICFNRIGESDQVYLESEFNEEEIFACLKDCNGDKAPGPDGFNKTSLISLMISISMAHS